MAGDHLRKLRELPAGNLDAGKLGPALEPFADLAEHACVDPLDSYVVDQCERFGADADQVVYTHRDTVDADRVEASGLLCDDQLAADAVGAERDSSFAIQAEYAREVPRAE